MNIQISLAFGALHAHSASSVLSIVNVSDFTNWNRKLPFWLIFVVLPHNNLFYLSCYHLQKKKTLEMCRNCERRKNGIFGSVAAGLRRLICCIDLEHEPILNRFLSPFK